MARRAFPFQGVLRPMRTKKGKTEKQKIKMRKIRKEERKVLENSSNYQSWTKHQLLSKYQI